LTFRKTGVHTTLETIAVEAVAVVVVDEAVAVVGSRIVAADEEVPREERIHRQGLQSC
jgi:hypothetical protein